MSLLSTFKCHMDKVISMEAGADIEAEQFLLITCKCIYFSENAYPIRCKIGKRSLMILNVLVTRHILHGNKLMPDIENSARKVACQSSNING